MNGFLRREGRVGGTVPRVHSLRPGRRTAESFEEANRGVKEGKGIDVAVLSDARSPVEARGREALDFIFVLGGAYVGRPGFGTAIALALSPRPIGAVQKIFDV